MPPPSTSSTQPTKTPSTSYPRARLHPPSTILLIYPATLLLGSLFSVLSPTAQQPQPPTSATAQTQQTQPQPQPVNYFARKNNIFNLYFVKVGWVWMTAAFLAILLSYPAQRHPQPAQGRRLAQAALRYTLATVVWYGTTQWFLGPAIIDRSFVFTGGRCERVLAELGQDERETGLGIGLGEDRPLSVYLTAAACKAAGGAWRGGHDVSGHVFLLVLVTAVLGFEAYGVWRAGALEDQGTGAGVDGVDGDVKGESASTVDSGSGVIRTWLMRFVAMVIALSWWMLLMTAIWFHTWLEKLNGLLLALAAVYTIYILPRRVIPWRNVVGIPGI